MWLSKMLSKENISGTAERGTVTMSGAGGVEADGALSARNVTSYLPYGYSAYPPVGEEILLLPSENGMLALGVKSSADGLASGEIQLLSKGGASLVLKNNGEVIINGALVIDREGGISHNE